MMKARLLAIAAITVFALSTFAAGDASARGTFGRFYGRSFNNPGWMHSASISRSPGMVSGMRSFQTPGGRGATRTFNRSCASGTCMHSVSTTTNSGKTWSRSSSVTHTNGSTSWNRTGTSRNGGTSSHTGSCTSGAGCTSSASATGANGNNYSAQRSLTPNGQGGYNYNATLTGPNGSVTHSFP